MLGSIDEDTLLELILEGSPMAKAIAIVLIDERSGGRFIPIIKNH